MVKKIYSLLFSVFAFAAVGVDAQMLKKQITNDTYKFRLDLPAGVASSENAPGAVVEYRAADETLGKHALFFLKRVITLRQSPAEKMEAYMKDASTVENFDKDFIESMKQSFPDIKSLERSFAYFGERPAVQGTYSFTVDGEQIKGRYVLLFVKEQTSVYVFSWASKTAMFDDWNKLAEKTVGSLKTY